MDFGKNLAAGIHANLRKYAGFLGRLEAFYSVVNTPKSHRTGYTVMWGWRGVEWEVIVTELGRLWRVELKIHMEMCTGELSPLSDL